MFQVFQINSTTYFSVSKNQFVMLSYTKQNAVVISSSRPSFGGFSDVFYRFAHSVCCRLGSDPGGIDDIKRHSFFSSIDWDKLMKKQTPPPFQPTLVADEAFYFDQEYTSRTPKGSFVIILVK